MIDKLNYTEMEKIEIPSGNAHIDWLLSGNTSIEDYAIGDVIRFLIQKHNELIDHIEKPTNPPKQIY